MAISRSTRIAEQGRTFSRTAEAALVAASLLFGVRAAAAQSFNPDSCGVQVREDTLTDTVYAWIPPLAHGAPVAEHDFQADQARVAIGAMGPLLLNLGAPHQALNSPLPPAGAPDLPGISMLIWFQVRDDGKLVGLRLERASGWELLDTTMQRAILRADSLHTLLPLPAALRRQGIDLWLAAGVGRAADAVNYPLASYRHVEVHYEGNEQQPRLLGVAYRPRFPDAALREGIGARMVFEFVIDTTGFVVPASIVPLRAEFREFAEEGMRAVRAARFSPSMIGRCKVQRRVQMPLDFFIQQR